MSLCLWHQRAYTPPAWPPSRRRVVCVVPIPEGEEWLAGDTVVETVVTPGEPYGAVYGAPSWDIVNYGEGYRVLGVCRGRAILRTIA